MQRKLSAAAADAERILLSGVHSTRPSEEVENLPVWVESLRKYFEKKKRCCLQDGKARAVSDCSFDNKKTHVPPTDSLDHHDNSHKEAT